MINPKVDNYTNESIIIWRVLSCIGVLMVHLGWKMSLEGNLRAFTDFGQYGVYLFFIISGYLSCFSRELQEGNVLRYWYKRVIRILPLYYFVIIVYYIAETYIYQTVPVDSTGLGWSRYFFLLSGFVKSDTKFWYNIGFTWTIPVFLSFYLLVPLKQRLIKNYWQSWMVIAFFVVLSYVIKLYGSGNLSACTYLYFFDYGIMFYYCGKENKERETIFLISVILIGFLVFLNPINVNIDYYANIYALIIVLLLISTQQLKVHNRIIKEIIVVLDQYSYTIYLVQGIVFEEMISKHVYPPRRVLLTGIIGTVILSYIVYNLYEKPIHKALAKLEVGKSR